VRPILAPEPLESLSPGEPPTFSAVIAAYQAAASIAGAIDSLIAQTLPPIEIIICDDGSSDDLTGALAPYLDRISLIRQKNRGPASARNVAARAASGDFVAILDADDIYYPERLEALSELSIRRPDLDILTTDCRVVLGDKFIRNCYHEHYRFATGDQRKAILRENFVGPGHMAVRREAFLAVGGLDERFVQAEDWDCWIRMIFSGSRVGLVNEPLAEYRVNPAGLASDRVRLSEGRVAALEKTELRDDLSPDERRVLRESLANQRRILTLRTARAALLDSTADARRLALEVARTKGLPSSLRLKAGVAAVFPRLAGRRLARGKRELAAGVWV
jgi:cellulose synthase/poly-beta-1,6-N-acetylglucosamine synthase-like glycosyltransferase